MPEDIHIIFEAEIDMIKNFVKVLVDIIEIYNGDKKSFYTKEILERLTICTDT